jgi:hypothetical protein
MPEVGVARRGRAAGGLAVVAVAALALAMVALVYANTSSEWPASVMMSEGQRTTKLAWGGFTLDMQKEADKALRLCKVGLLGSKQHCATHVVSTEDTKWTHTDAGQPVWEESTNVLDSQVTHTHVHTHNLCMCIYLMIAHDSPFCCLLNAHAVCRVPLRRLPCVLASLVSLFLSSLFPLFFVFWFLFLDGFAQTSDLQRALQPMS